MVQPHSLAENDGHRSSPGAEEPGEPSGALGRLRRQVARAIQEIRDLRRENEGLRKRIDEMAAMNGPIAAGDVDPEELREAIDAFLQRIDRYLENQA